MRLAANKKVSNVTSPNHKPLITNHCLQSTSYRLLFTKFVA